MTTTNYLQTETWDLCLQDQLTQANPTIDESDFAADLLLEEWRREVEARILATKLSREEDTKAQRKIDAEVATGIRREDARRDLFLNQTSPFLFRKYMSDYHAAMTRELEKSWFPLSTIHKQDIRAECGLEVGRIVHNPGCGNHTVFNYNPTDEWVFDIPYDERVTNTSGVSPDGRNMMIRYALPCFGGCGQCWDGSWYDQRPVPDPKPFKTNWCLPESWD